MGDDYLTVTVVGPGGAMRGRFKRDIVLFWRDVTPDEKAKDVRLNTMLVVSFAPTPLGLANRVEEIDEKLGVAP